MVNDRPRGGRHRAPARHRRPTHLSRAYAHVRNYRRPPPAPAPVTGRPDLNPPTQQFNAVTLARILRGPQTLAALGWRVFVVAAVFAAVATLVIAPVADVEAARDPNVATLMSEMDAVAPRPAPDPPSVATLPEPAIEAVTTTPAPTTTSSKARARTTTPPTTRRTPSRTPSRTTAPSTARSTTTTPPTTTTTEDDDEADRDDEEGAEPEDDAAPRDPGPDPEVSATPLPASSSRFLAIARTYAAGPRVPYDWGGKDIRAGVDCSGFVWAVLRKGGLTVPYRNSQALASWGTAVSRADARPGDLALWRGHVAIYAGGDMIVDASSSQDDITERKLWGSPTFRRIPS